MPELGCVRLWEAHATPTQRHLSPSGVHPYPGPETPVCGPTAPRGGASGVGPEEACQRRGRRLLGGLVKIAVGYYATVQVYYLEVQPPAILEMEGQPRPIGDQGEVIEPGYAPFDASETGQRGRISHATGVAVVLVDPQLVTGLAQEIAVFAVHRPIARQLFDQFTAHCVFLTS